MSNQEPKALTARLNLEKQYKDLTSGQKSEGRKMAEEVLKNTGKNLANEYAKKAAVKGIELAVKAAMSR
jgi:vacuolar-type H+-ATPase subunit H